MKNAIFYFLFYLINLFLFRKMYFSQHNVFGQNETPLFKPWNVFTKICGFVTTLGQHFVFIASLPCVPDN